jgi:hypothetical protein
MFTIPHRQAVVSAEQSQTFCLRSANPQQMLYYGLKAIIVKMSIALSTSITLDGNRLSKSLCLSAKKANYLFTLTVLDTKYKDE